MDKEYRYALQKGSKKHHCPKCGKKTFVLYVDNETGQPLPNHYGRCDREAKCGHHLNPYSDGFAKASKETEVPYNACKRVSLRKNDDNDDNDDENKTIFLSPTSIAEAKPAETKPVYFDFETFKQTLKGYDKNVFLQNLASTVPYPFEVEDVTRVVEMYYLGTIEHGYRSGAITFPFIDIAGNVRAVQVKQFDDSNHTTGTDFLHSMIEKHHKRNNRSLPLWLQDYINQDKRVSCLFGEHLLAKYPSNPIALVEAPKTAIYGALYFGLPTDERQFIWLAVYNKSSFNLEKLKPLQGRFVYVFPDLSKDGSTFKEWQAKAKEAELHLPGTKFIFSALLEKLAPETDRQNGNDLADFLIRLDWRAFRTQTSQPALSPEPDLQAVQTDAHESEILIADLSPGSLSIPLASITVNDVYEDLRAYVRAGNYSDKVGEWLDNSGLMCELQGCKGMTMEVSDVNPCITAVTHVLATISQQATLSDVLHVLWGYIRVNEYRKVGITLRDENGCAYPTSHFPERKAKSMLKASI